MEQNPNSKEKKETGKRLIKGCFIGCLVIIILYIVAFAILVSLGVIVFKRITAHSGGIEGIYMQFMDTIRGLLGRIKDFFYNNNNGVKTL